MPETETILIPTDFSAVTLDVIEEVLKREGGRFNFILVHGVNLPFSIVDLLFISVPTLLGTLSNDFFDKACARIRKRHATRIGVICKDVFTGTSQRAFNNYLEAKGIRRVCIPEGIEWSFHHKDSFDLIPFLVASAVPVEKVPIAYMRQKDELGPTIEDFYKTMSI